MEATRLGMLVVLGPIESSLDAHDLVCDLGPLHP